MSLLLTQDLFLLFLIIILGQLLGAIRFKSVSLGSSGIIFVALAFGHYGYSLPKVFQTLGLVLFIYSIGLQAGPGFLASFQQRGKRLTFGAFILVTLGCLTTILGCWFLNYSSDIAAGVFAGALTSTPSLAVVVEATQSDKAAAAYGLTYCFGVLGVILFVKFIPQILKINIRNEEKELFDQISKSTPQVDHHHIQISNPNVFGRSVRDLNLMDIASVSITRHLKKGMRKAEQVVGDTILNEGDIVRVVGTEADLAKVEMFFGNRVDREIKFMGEIVNKKVVVSHKDAVGRSVGSINFMDTYNIQLARISRSGIDLPADPQFRLHKGDVLHLVGERKAIANAAKLIGNDMKTAYMTDVIAMIIGIFLGVFIGKIPIVLPYLGNFSLGLTGGVLLTGLILGYLHNTRNLIWEMPVPTNTFIRELGLMLFLATVGISAGATFLDTIRAQGLSLFLIGISVTLIPLFFGYFICRKMLKIPVLYTFGLITGGMTSTPGLAATTSLSETHFASSAYATVYPVALISMIVFTKIIIWVWGVL